MDSTQRVRNVLEGKPVDRQPIYGWVRANLNDKLVEKWGSADAFEDKYEFDMSHIFGGPRSINCELLEKLPRDNGELLPETLLEADIFTDPSNDADYDNVRQQLEHHKKRQRFCYAQTPGFFENFNGVFGIENQLMYLAMYPDEIGELYKRQAEWTKKFIDKLVEAGVDMIHFSDDWGAQKDIMFSPDTWWELIYPNMKQVVDYAHSKGVYASLHSDGCVMKVADGIKQIGFDMVHPWQENAGMSYDTYLEKYSNDFAILGGLCVQSAIGLLDRDGLEREIRRVFKLLKGKRWICCTTHYVQEHCKIDDLEFAYNLIYKLARE